MKVMVMMRQRFEERLSNETESGLPSLEGLFESIPCKGEVRQVTVCIECQIVYTPCLRHGN